MLIYSVTYIISIRVLIVSLYQIQRMKIMRWEEMSAQYIFHNATCGSIRLKQDKVTTAQYCILQVKERKLTNMNAHADSHTF